MQVKLSKTKIGDGLMNDYIFPKSLVDYISVLTNNGVPENKLYRYVNEFLELSAREKGIPLHGGFELTPLCNLNCKMCYVHLSTKQYKQSQLIKLETWKGFISEAYKLGMRYASLTGGECLSYPWFDELYKFLIGKDIKTSVLTNGILLNRDRIDFFKSYPPRNIQVTVYGSCDETYKKVTGKGAFSLVQRNILSAKEAGLPIKVSITPSKFMWGDIEETLHAVDKLDVPYYVNAFLSPPRQNTGRALEDLTVEQYISVYKKRNELSNIGELPCIDLADLPYPNYNRLEKQGLRCGAGRSSFLIKYDGTMSPCVSMSYISVNTLYLGFEKAWKQVHNAAISYRIPSECDDCLYSGVCLRCATLHRNAPKEGHCDPRVCERTRKMVSAGVLPNPLVSEK